MKEDNAAKSTRGGMALWCKLQMFIARNDDIFQSDCQNFGAIIVAGHDAPDMDYWIINQHPKRIAPAVRSPGPLDNTQMTDSSTQPSQPTIDDSQISGAASELLANPNIADDYRQGSFVLSKIAK